MNYLRKGILILIFLAVSHFLFPQNQKKADSLILVYNKNSTTGEARLKLLDEIAANLTIYQDKIKYSNLLIAEANKSGSNFWLYRGYMELGSGYRLVGDLSLAMDSYLK